MLATTCPSRETLLRYPGRPVSEEQSSELVDHLASAPTAQATILTLADADDTLIHRLRMPLTSESYLAEPEFQAAVADAIAMPVERPPGKSGRLGREPAAMPPTLGEYHLIEELGRGGMGRVYKALHTKLDRVVALKILSRGRGEIRRPLPASSGRCGPLADGASEHRPGPRCPRDRRHAGLIMEFVDGLDLAEIVRRTRGRCRWPRPASWSARRPWRCNAPTSTGWSIATSSRRISCSLRPAT